MHYGRANNAQLRLKHGTPGTRIQECRLSIHQALLGTPRTKLFSEFSPRGIVHLFMQKQQKAN